MALTSAEEAGAGIGNFGSDMIGVNALACPDPIGVGVSSDGIGVNVAEGEAVGPDLIGVCPDWIGVRSVLIFSLKTLVLGRGAKK